MGKKDEELLLVNMEKGSDDSDEVVEEFKLPPPRSRRKRKHLPDTRVQGGSSLITWKCCFAFIILSILISAGLVLAFFIYNMYNQLYHLKKQVESYRGNSNTIFSKHEQKIKMLEAKHFLVSSFEDNHKLMINKMDRLNATVQELVKGQGANTGMSGAVSHQFTTLKNDVEALQSSSAKAEATLSSTQQLVLKTIQEMKKDIETVKVDSLNPTANKMGTEGEETGDETSSFMTRTQVNELLKKYSSQSVSSQNTVSSQDVLSGIAALKMDYQAMNTTHNQDLLRLAKTVVRVKKGLHAFEKNFTTLYQPIIMDLKTATQDVFTQLTHHNNTFERMDAEMKVLKDEVTFLNASHANVAPIPATAPAINNVNATPTIKKPVIVQTTPKTMKTTAAGAAGNKGPVLPKENGIHKTSSATESPPASSIISSTPSHVMNTTFNKTVHEQKAKKNETENSFKDFQSVTPATDGKIPPNNNGASQQSPDNINNKNNNQDDGNSDDQNMNPGDAAGEEESQGNNHGEEGADDGEDGQDAADSSEGLSRVLQLLRSNKLSDAQRRELVQRLLKAQGPDYGGD